MLISKAPWGCIVWLTTNEQNDEEVLEEIDRLKASTPITIYCSGCEETLQVLSKAVKSICNG